MTLITENNYPTRTMATETKAPFSRIRGAAHDVIEELRRDAEASGGQITDERLARHLAAKLKELDLGVDAPPLDEARIRDIIENFRKKTDDAERELTVEDLEACAGGGIDPFSTFVTLAVGGFIWDAISNYGEVVDAFSQGLRDGWNTK